MKKILFLIVLTTGIFAHSQNIWECDFGKNGIENWKTRTLLHEIIDGSLRVRVASGASGNYAKFYKSVPAGGNDCYLQVHMGDLENSTAKPGVSSSSSGEKGFGGPLFPGWNTFSMSAVAQKNFYLSFAQLGNRDKDGAWVDYISARITKIPKNGLTVTLESNDGIAKIGDKLIFRYYAAEPLIEQTLEASCFIAPQFIDYRFNKDSVILLKNTGIDNIYEAQIEITSDALTYKKAPKAPLITMVKTDQMASYFTLPFELNIKTANIVPKAMTAAANPQVRRDRQLWFDRTRGTNLAKGKSISMHPLPDYALTTNDSDPTDLTDGKLTVRADDKVWFDKNAVGWYYGNGGEIYLQVDLGKEQPLDRLVVRCLGGTSSTFKFPKQFDLYVSKDGNTWFSAASMQKLMPGESSQSDFKKYYYLEESGTSHSTRMYPFELGIQAEARYVLLKITGETESIFTDELAIIKAETHTAEFNQPYQSAEIVIPMDGVIIRPRIAELAAIKNLPAPQRFVIDDMRKKEEKNKPVSLVLELPESLEVILPKTEAKLVDINGKKYQRFEFPLIIPRKGKFRSPTLFLGVTDNKTNDPAYIYARSEGKDQFKTELPVKIVELAPIKPFERLHISLTWMSESDGINWPDFFKNWRKLGFNTVGSFPRWWRTGKDARFKDYLDAARKDGFKVIMNDSAFHEMKRGHKPGSEIFCQIPGETHRILCPSYRGSYYDKEMERVTRCVREGKPDYVFYDIECWCASGVSRCSRCQEALKKSGKSINEFLLDCGTETMHDLNVAVKAGAKQAGIPEPVQASYNRHALKPVYKIDDFARIYPDYISMAHPSLYVVGRAENVHDTIRGNHKLMKNKQIIPWLSTGAYGEFESYKVEPMVLESLLNGAGGVTYYSYNFFTDSPLDFFYHAKALAQIRPHEDLIADGEVLEPTGTNQEFLYSGVKKDGEMLLLVGNYVNAPEKTVVKLPFDKVTAVTDLRSGKKINGNSNFAFEVPKGDIRLFHITGE